MLAFEGQFSPRRRPSGASGRRGSGRDPPLEEKGVGPAAHLRIQVVAIAGPDSPVFQGPETTPLGAGARADAAALRLLTPRWQ